MLAVRRLVSSRYRFANLSSVPWPTSRNDRDDDGLQEHQQRRTYHATDRQEIITLIVFLAAGGAGWYALRKYQGKTVTPDQAAQAQQAYREQQERLRRQQSKVDYDN